MNKVWEKRTNTRTVGSYELEFDDELGKSDLEELVKFLNKHKTEKISLTWNQEGITFKAYTDSVESDEDFKKRIPNEIASQAHNIKIAREAIEKLTKLLD